MIIKKTFKKQDKYYLTKGKKIYSSNMRFNLNSDDYLITTRVDTSINDGEKAHRQLREDSWVHRKYLTPLKVTAIYCNLR